MTWVIPLWVNIIKGFSLSLQGSPSLQNNKSSSFNYPSSFSDRKSQRSQIRLQSQICFLYIHVKYWLTEIFLQLQIRTTPTIFLKNPLLICAPLNAQELTDYPSHKRSLFQLPVMTESG